MYPCLLDINRYFLRRMNFTLLEQTKDIPPLENVLDLVEENLPLGMDAFSVGYELYHFRGEGVKELDTPVFNSTLYKLQPTDSFLFKPVRLSSSELGKPDPMNTQIDGKVYVLAIKDEEACGSVHHIGNGKMCSVCFKSTDEFYWAISVAIFQVNISSNMDHRKGKCEVTTDLLRHHIFKAGSDAQYFIFVDAFIMSEGLGKRGLEFENPGKSSKRTMTFWGVHSQ